MNRIIFAIQKEINCRKNVAGLTGKLAGLTLAKNIVEDLTEEPQLNENQQIVLEYLKKMCPPKLDASAMVTVYRLVDDNINDNWQEYSEKIPGHIEALQKLTITEENQVLQAFASWVLEQEEE